MANAEVMPAGARRLLDSDVLFALGIVTIVTILILPIPPILIDLGLAVSIALSALILMVSLWIKRPLEFSAFPTVLLLATILRLALNIGTTRLILSHGNQGATRIAEVGARFTLDAIPGKQMSIDADLSAGLINEKEAQSRRRELEEESAFFGAMDGASKFVRGDAIAALIITVVNVFGGIVIGVAHYGMPIGQAADVYTKLSVGDGLVSQIPALI